MHNCVCTFVPNRQTTDSGQCRYGQVDSDWQTLRWLAVVRGDKGFKDAARDGYLSSQQSLSLSLVISETLAQTIDNLSTFISHVCHCDNLLQQNWKLIEKPGRKVITERQHFEAKKFNLKLKVYWMIIKQTQECHLLMDILESPWNKEAKTKGAFVMEKNKFNHQRRNFETKGKEQNLFNRSGKFTSTWPGGTL